MRRSRRPAGLRKFNFLLSAKQTNQGKKKCQVEMGAGRPDKCCQEPETKGHTWKSCLLRWKLDRWHPEGTWTCSACSTLWLPMFPSLPLAARQLRWCLDKVIHAPVQCFQDISTWRWWGASLLAEDGFFPFSFLSLVVQNLSCSSFSFNLVQWWKRPTGACLADEASRC